MGTQYGRTHTEICQSKGENTGMDIKTRRNVLTRVPTPRQPTPYTYKNLHTDTQAGANSIH